MNLSFSGPATEGSDRPTPRSYFHAFARRSAISGVGSVKPGDVNEVADDLEVGGVGSEEWHAVNVRRCRDREIDRAAPWLAAALRDRSGQAAPLAGDSGIDREGVKRRLDHTESLYAKRALVAVLRDERTEV